jgi:hypothetical protein
VHEDDLPLTAKLIDVCSFPSVNPNSDPSDCVVFTSCANLNCPSMGCNQQVCSTELGKCVPRNGTAVCNDGVECTIDVCEITCDSSACALNPQPSFQATPVDVNGCRYQGREYDACEQGSSVASSQCGCQGTACQLAEAARRRRQVLPELHWCVVTNTSLVDPNIRFGSDPPPVSAVPPPADAKDVLRPGCRQPATTPG